MIIWVIFCLFAITPFPVLLWKKNRKIFLLAILPLIYVLLDVYIECKVTKNHSEACVWGYFKYLYAVVIGSAFYLIVTFFQVVISKLQKSKSGDSAFK